MFMASDAQFSSYGSYAWHSRSFSMKACSAAYGHAESEHSAFYVTFGSLLRGRDPF